MKVNLLSIFLTIMAWITVVKVGFSILACIVLILSEKFYSEPLFTTSVTMIKYFVATWKYTKFDEFILAITDITLIVICGVSALYILFKGPLIKHILLYNTVFAGSFVLALLKNVYQDMRPSWSSVDIPIIVHEKDYGNPSGHSLNGTVLLIAALCASYYDNEDLTLTTEEKEAVRESNEMESVFSKFYAKAIILLGAALFLSVLLFSRIYLGAHAINQVLYGFLWGLLVTVLIWMVFRTELVSFYKRLLTSEETDSTKCIIIFLNIFVLAFLPNIFVYYSSNPSFDPILLKRIQEANPGFTTSTPLLTAFHFCGFSGGWFGLHFALLCRRKVAKIDFTRITIRIHFLKHVGRICVPFIVFGLIFFFCFMFVPTNPPSFFVLRTLLPSGISIFLVILYGDTIADKLRWLGEFPSHSPALLEEKKEYIGISIS